MGASAKQYAGNPFQWLSSWLHQGDASTSRHPAPDYSALALELSACNNLQEMVPVLVSLQKRVRNIFFDCSESDLCLMLPGSVGDNLECIAAGEFSDTLQQALCSHITQVCHQPETDHRIPDILYVPEVPKGALMLQMLECGEQTAWLALYFRGFHPPAERVAYLTSGLRNALTRGLEIYLRHRATVQDAVREERAIQAAELHDSLAQVLGYLRMRTARLQTLCHNELGSDEQAIRDYADDLASQTLFAYRQMRELISTSRLCLKEETLDRAIASAIEELEQHSGIVFELDNRCPELQLSQEQLIQLSYIARESLTNIVRHSHATHARVLVSQKHQRLRIRIEDNGEGILPARARTDSFGLKIMQERAGRIGARLSITPLRQGGTRVELILVLAQ